MDCDRSGSYMADLFRRKLYYPKPQTPEIGGKEEELPWYDEEEEERMLEEEISKSEGFDVDFSKYRSCNGFFPVELDDDFFVEESETNVDLLERLSREALDRYNGEKGTEVKFANVVKANWYPCKGVMFFITFEVIDPVSSDGQPILYQAQIRYFCRNNTEFILCRPKPCQKKD